MENTSTQKPKESKKDMSKAEMDKFANDLAKKITKMNYSRKRSRWNFFGLNPWIVLATVGMAVILFASFYVSPISTNKLTLNQLLSGLKNNEYSEVIIQNDGSVFARDKFIYYVQTGEESLNDVQLETEESKKLNKFSTYEDESVDELSMEEFINALKPVSVIDSIRNLFRGEGTASIQQVIFTNDNVLAITSKNTKDYVLNISKADFEKNLADQGLSLKELGIPSFELSSYGAELAEESIESRISKGLVSNVVELENVTYAIANTSAVNLYSLDWTPRIDSFTEVLQREGFKLDSESANFEIISKNISEGLTFNTILNVLTIVGFVFLGFVIFKSAQASGVGIMQFGQSKAKMFFGQKTNVSFDDVAGIDEAREELNEIVDFLKNPSKYRKLGARIPKGILMFGAPGTGKTLLARAIAGEAGVPFFHTSGSEFEEMLVGAGASRVRDLFAKAKKAAPALIFIDEIDAVARKRGTRIQSGSTEQTLNQILVEMDGFETNTNVIVIAATNRPDVLDPAILRPGRFDRQVRIETPDKDGRVQILKIHSKNKPLAKDVNLETIAKRTVGFSGADLENIMNEAAIITAKDNRKEITTKDIDDAVSKVVLGPAKKSRKRTDDELKLVAYHEAGHALVAKFTEKAVPVDKISIVSRGNSGGVTMFLPEKDENIISMKRLIANIRVSLGGRAAEEVVLGDISTGASNDIEQATRAAKGMIKKYGMSKDLGLVQYGQSSDSGYLGYHYDESKDYSEKTAEMIDAEVREIIAGEYKEALKIMKDKRDLLDKLANLLLEKEVLEKEEFEKLFEGEK